MDIYPSILARSRDEFALKVERVRHLELPLHIDIMDGEFVPERTWSDTIETEDLLEGLHYSVHLMVSHPEHDVPVWLASPTERTYFHTEATHRQDLIARTVNDRERIGLAINPETPVSDLAPFLDLVSSVLVMSVEPGRSGQEFMPEALQKIKTLRGLDPRLHIVVDGGIKPHNIASIADAGANAAVIGSALTDSPNPTLALQEFRHAFRPDRVIG